MPRVEARVVVKAPIDVAFAISQTTGELRLRWDPFIRRQHLLNGASAPAKGVQTHTVSRHRLSMVSEYVSFRAPNQVGMKMVKGPRFFSSFAGGWSFAELPEGTEATWRYTFSTRPAWLAPIADRIGVWLLGRDINARIAAFARACESSDIVAAVTSSGATATRPGDETANRNVRGGD
jgi:hypothetical protein